jgi:hypothetical protein
MGNAITRRDVLALMGTGAVAYAARATAFPKHAIIRTLAKGIPPEQLGNGATLFHEHLSLDSGRLIGPRSAKPEKIRVRR